MHTQACITLNSVYIIKNHEDIQIKSLFDPIDATLFDLYPIAENVGKA